MARFEVAILTDRLVKRATRDLMWTPQMPSDGLGRMVYGLGWQAGTTPGGVRDVGHGGAGQGTSTMMLIAPDARAGVAVLINSDASGSAVASELLDVVLGTSREHKEIAVDPKLYDGYIGTCQLNDSLWTLAREGDHLLVQTNGQNFQVFPESVRDYFFKVVNDQITFVTDNGRATELILHEGGGDMYFNRVK